MIDFTERITRAARRRLPGGVTGAIERMASATAGAATTLTEAQIEVLTLLAYEVGTVRDLCAARGIGVRSTNAIAEHLAKLEARGLIERTRPRDGTAYRYAPWELTSAGWRTLGPCEHIPAAIARGDMFAASGPGLHVGGDSLRPAIDPGRILLPPAPGAAVGEPLSYCPWCGWRLW